MQPLPFLEKKIEMLMIGELNQARESLKQTQQKAQDVTKFILKGAVYPQIKNTHIFLFAG